MLNLPTTMRKIISAMQVTLDGFIEGSEGEMDWVASGTDCYEILDRVDTCLLGAEMYPTYEKFWTAVLANPNVKLEPTNRVPEVSDVEYARWAAHTQHVVLSTTMPSVKWENSRIIRNLDEVRALKEAAGQDIYAVGGGKLTCSLLEAGLLDELRLVVTPLILGSGKPLFSAVRERHKLTLTELKVLTDGLVRLTYNVGS